MAASEEFYRDQKTLDVIFGVSSILMLLSIVWMFVQDFNREYKVEQRRFRDVEEALSSRAALQALPDPEQIRQAEEAVSAAQARVNSQQDRIAELRRVIADETPRRVRAENAYQALKADFDSISSLYNIAVEEHGPESSEAKVMRGQINRMQKELIRLQAEVDAVKSVIETAQAELTALQKPLTEALASLKRLHDEFDRIARNAVSKRWKFTDTFRALPVIDAFASPIRIQQFTLEELPIDYNFKYVTRFDRCMTCHLGIDKPAFTREALRQLGEVPAGLDEKLAKARDMLAAREKLLAATGETLGYDPNALRLTTVPIQLKHIGEFAAHPRLDLFVSANSPHPAEKFGCTVCHAGQGASTSFALASHTPNSADDQERWEHEHGWYHVHYWDFPMLPKRFLEASCVKCHHQITDLIRDGSRIEAPKLIRGYNLVREFGCFGCHEISGIKNGRWVGPDLRLEPYPPLDDLTPAERTKALADPLNPPGTMRKVGPSLKRLAEKTNEAWVRKWLRAPRDFRPDTKMPHFYGLSNNSFEVLSGTDQGLFPSAEIHAITYYLFQRSQSYLSDVARHMKDPPEQRQKDQQRYDTLSSAPAPTNAADKEKVQKELEELAHVMALRRAAPPIENFPLPPPPTDPNRGRALFIEKGCLACHIHESTAKAQPGQPALASDAHFGPNLTRLAAKLGTAKNDDSARRWLVRWILNPTDYHPRTFMPVTHLTIEEANEIAGWLLSQPADWQAPDVIAPGMETLKKLARVYLDKVLTRREVEALFDPKSHDRAAVNQRLEEMKRRGADEGELAGGVDEHKLKMYIGRKAIGQLGCYGCHDIPGFETAKPIGTPLNDWGKKDPERLAFEDIMAYVRQKHYPAPGLVNREGQYYAPVNGKKPYDNFFWNALEHHQREGFLYQKLMEPRSYDTNRIRSWDERLRMPQFRFARTVKREGESDEEFEARREVEEAEAREAVMTFVLGLVAEPVPLKYVHQPPPDRLAEVKGRQVLDKYNCAGCHLVRPGVFEFKATPETLAMLEAAYQLESSATYKPDFHFLNHNAWTAQSAARSDRLTARGIRPQLLPDPNDESKQLVLVRLTEALRFTSRVDGQEEVRDLRAFGNARIAPADMIYPPPSDFTSPEKLAESQKHRGPYGGTFADLLVAYLIQKDPEKYKAGADGDSTDGRAAAPPALLREGEKVQPEWLYQFLRQPHEIRPVTVLRMPRFNLSDDEAMQLVNYFAAVDRVGNPAAGIRYPYLSIPQTQESFWREKTAVYVERLKRENLLDQRLKELEPLWAALLERETIPEVRRKLEQAEALIKAAIADEQRETDPAKKAAAQANRKQAEADRDRLAAELKDLETQVKDRSFRTLKEAWLTNEAYATDAYRLLANYDLCLGCHQVGNIAPKQKAGPPLDLTWRRLRPEWTQFWLANPQRFMSYITPMPQNFPADKKEYQAFFAGDSLEQVTAVRDVLLNFPRVSDMPVNRYRGPTSGTGGQ
ncbi:MAG: c-type cytochrome [Gemmataceae bacterium]|nr:c-type cytochrome [Gemmataceae bacterium]MDW8265705.1 c-type cytochrome [Gemmataceae bacterium]